MNYADSMTINTESFQHPVAIIGMGSMFAKSRNIKEYWRTLLNGIDCITDPPATHRQLQDGFDSDPKRPDHIYCNRGGFLPTVPFDPTEFGIPPAALEATDTSQLLGLVAAKMALSDAGYGDDREFDREHTSVILGVTGTQELVISLGSRLGHPLWRNALANKGLSEAQKTSIIADISNSYVPWQENSFPGLLGNVVAGRICNRLNLGGTNCVVDAACASSLGAVHLGLMELNAGKSNMVVTGGVDTINDIFMHMCFAKTGVLSHTGDARPFSADADGTVLGEGIGILVLKRLADAERDGDRIYAVIRGIGSSSDGKSQSIYAPRPEGQARALIEAYRNAGITPETVALIEAHGTGTRVGDEMEFTALKNVFGAVNPNGNRCALGSVKSMIGHTKAAAGAAGLIKAALSLHNKILPPTLKADKPDPKLGIESSPFYLNTALRPWFSKNGIPRRSGVSSFGFGGSNFHVVLEEYGHAKKEIAWDGSVEILAFSGPEPTAITGGLHQINQLFGNDFDTAVLSRTARTLRTRFSSGHPYRLVMVMDTTLDGKELKERLHKAIEIVTVGKSADLAAQGIYYRAAPPSAGKIAFMFPGQGSQYTNMGRDLACCFPGAMQAIETAGAHFDPANPLWELLFPHPARSDEHHRQQEDALRRTDVAQPAIGATSLAMLAVLDYFRVRPDTTCGHSYGELPALYAAGWIDRETLLTLSCTRGRLMADTGSNGDAGTMLAVKAPIEAIKALSEEVPDVVLANINCPDQGVLSGTTPAIKLAAGKCAEKGYRAIALPVAAAFHSPLVEGAGKPFSRAAAKIAFTPTRIPVYANATAAPYPADPSGCADLLSRQLTSPVLFQETVEHLYASGVRTFVEVGPKAVLCGLVRSTLKDKAVTVIALDRSAGKASGIMDLAHAIAHLAASGADIDLNRWETAPPAARPQKMVIPLSGTNYRAPRKTSPNPVADPQATVPTLNHASQPVVNPTEKIVDANPPMEIFQPKRITAPPAPPDQPLVQHRPTNPTSGADMNDALTLVQQGLATIQSLQEQTAQAHQKFLETQAQASRTLQEMLKSTHLFIGSSLGISMPPVPGFQESVANPQPVHHRSPSMPMPLPAATAEHTPVAAATGVETEPSVSDALPPPPTTPQDHRASIAKTLTGIVAELTGYPDDMLGLDMDIEADLGIDSIKRVEILSAMEAHMPHLPQVTPDMVGSLKTLGQICDFLAQARQSATAPPPANIDAAIAPAEDGATVRQTLLSVVAELTGYPDDMLGLDMDIEADLGIDSIKRVEILSAMEARMPHLPQVTPDMVGSLKTLGQICAYLSGGDGQPEIDTTPCSTMPASQANAPSSETIPRQIIDVVDAPQQPGRALNIEPGRWIGVLNDHTPLAQSLVSQLAGKDIAARLIPSEAVDNAANFTGAAGLVLCASTCPENAFLAAKHAAVELFSASRNGDALLAVVTCMDGAFGFTGNAFDNPEQGALPGLVKTAALEWESVICRAIDLGPDFSDPDRAAQQVVEELLSVRDPILLEIGLRPDRRVTLKPVPAQIDEGPIRFDSREVVVVTGGARGVTAACALCLARASGVSIALVGRSLPLFEGPPWLEGVDGEAAMKKAILENASNGSQPTPKRLEAAYRKHAANRSIALTIDALKASGVNAAYFSADVTDRDSLNAVINTIRSEMGPIAGLIHGAGVIHDRLIVDKTVQQFRQVYATKVDGLKNLLSITRADNLRHLVLFSSVSARTGNSGQCDYAMANEALNKIARWESLHRPGCRVSAINWGPWDGGMVTPTLKKTFDAKNIGLIPIQTGARLMVAEMKNTDPGPVEVLIGSMLTIDTGPAESAEVPMALLERRELDLQRYPVLASHIIGGKPVVPFALITEWIGHGALKDNPGYALHGIDDFRLLSGIRIEDEKKLVRLMGGKARKSGDTWQVDMELRNGVKNGRDVIHSRARALLVDRLPDAPVFKGSGNNGGRAYPRDLDTIYGEVLFHGDHLRAIKGIDDYSDHGMTARLTCAPKPEVWMQDPIQGSWLADPMVLDGAFQMAIVWCFEQTGKVCLPSYARAYRQYRPAFPVSGVTAVMAVTAATHRKMVADFTFLDDNHLVVATLSGYEATVDESLIHAFKNNGLQPVFKENQ
jgi:acyl transferase domain-containing protein/NAD(P)-dependent dehydrogenase (short-subunit alcohol dehydrogenase family)